MIYEILGWIGTASLIAAYYGVTSGKIGPKTKTYQSLNLVGAVLVGLNSYVHQALPSVGINALWVAIGVYGFYTITHPNTK